MASPLEFLLGSFKEYVTEKIRRNSVDAIKKEVQNATEMLSWWLSELKELEERKSKVISLNNQEREIRDLVRRLEDVREIFSIKMESSEGWGIIKIPYPLVIKDFSSFWELAFEVKEMDNRIRNSYMTVRKFDMLKIANRSIPTDIDREWSSHPNTLHRENHIIVGMDETIDNLSSLLFDQHHGVICISGTKGIGKTTLAQRLYHHRNVGIAFEGIAWVNIGENFSRREVFTDMLKQLLPQLANEITQPMSDVELARELYRVQKDKKCLVVFDDVWSTDDWESLEIAFPSTETRSKLLLTTQLRNTAAYVNGDTQNGIIHLNALNMENSWELFHNIVFSGNQDEVSLLKQQIAEDILMKCAGIPSDIIGIAEILATKQTLLEWEMVHQDARSLGIGGLQVERAQPILEFNNLPHHLKPCFLYLGLFPKGQEIDVEHLYLLWIAERLISLDGGQNNETMMDVAERYLTELVERNMIEVKEEETPVLRKYRSCWVHDQMRDHCLQKGEEHFFKFHDVGLETQRESYSSSSGGNYAPRRLALHFGEQEPRSQVQFTKIAAKHLCCLLLLNTYNLETKFEWPPNMCKMTKFTMLKVLNFERFEFQDSNVPKEVMKLIYLRYLSFKGCILKELPRSITHLSMLWILDLRVKSSSVMIIPDVLWKLEKLRHLYLPLIFQTRGKDKLHLGKLKQLQTLANFNTRWCNVGDLLEMKELLYLSATIEGNLEDLTRVLQKNMILGNDQNYLRASFKIKNFECYTEKRHSIFRKLLEYQILHAVSMDGHLGQIPPHHKITQSLTEIILIGSELNEDPMTTLENLRNLRVLVLQDDAFIGSEMNCSASGFWELKCLRLLSLRFLEKWEVENEALPKLSIVEIKNCSSLKRQTIADGLKGRHPPVTFENDIFCSRV